MTLMHLPLAVSLPSPQSFYAPRRVIAMPAVLNPVLMPESPVIPTNIRAVDGHTSVTGRSPDGDTIAIRVTDERQLVYLKQMGAKVKQGGVVTIRMQDIDTLETHFGNFHQPLRFADAATDFLLARSGVSDVVWSAGRQSIESAREAEGVTLLVSGVDGYGRVIGYVLPAGNDVPEGEFDLTPEVLKQTVNYHLLKEGHAFPMLYTDDQGRIDLQIIQEIARVVQESREANKGIWAEDILRQGAAILSIDRLENELVLYPKIFRRLVNYAENHGLDNLNGFLQYLAEHPDPLWLLSAGVLAGSAAPREVHLHEILEVTKGEDGRQQLKIKEAYEYLVFKPLYTRRPSTS